MEIKRDLNVRGFGGVPMRFMSKHCQTSLLILMLLQACEDSKLQDLDKVLSERTSSFDSGAALRLESDSFLFPSGVVGIDNLSLSLKMSNVSKAAIAIKDFSFAKDSKSESFSLTTSGCLELVNKSFAADSSCDLVVNFHPKSEGELSDALIVTFKELGRDQTYKARFIVSGTGASAQQVGNSALTYSPSTKSFGAVASGSSSNAVISVKNVLSRTMYISELSTNHDRFRVDESNCVSKSKLEKDESCSVTVSFNPNSSGVVNGSVIFKYGTSFNSKEFTSYFNMSGTGVSPISFAGIQSVTSVTHKSMRLNWNPNADAIAYNVMKIESGSPTLLKVVPNTGGSVAYTDLTSLLPSTSYTFRVNAIDLLGSAESNSVQLTQTTLANTAPLLTSIANPVVYSGVTISAINANNAVTGNDTDVDGDALTYSCRYDQTIDGVVSASAALCSTLLNQGGGNALFSTSTGQLSGWTPRFVDEGANFEFKIVAIDEFSASHSVTFSTNVGVGVQLATDILDTSTDEDLSKLISFQVFDGSSSIACNATYLSMTSSSPSVVANSGVVWGGTYPNCTATISPVANAYGTTTLTIQVSNGVAADSDSFVLTVASIPDSPSVSNITDKTTDISTLLSVSFTISDPDSTIACDATSLSVASTDTAIIPSANAVFSGSGGSCALTLSPVLNQVGSSTITVTLSDGSLSTQDTFAVTVRPPAFANLKTWLRADAGITMDGSNLVSQWADQSGNANHANSSGGLRPTFVTNAMGSKPALRAADSQSMTIANLGTTFTSAGSLFVVYKPNSDAQYSVVHFGHEFGHWRYTGDGHGYNSTFRTVRLSANPPSQPTTGTNIATYISDSSRYLIYANGNEVLGEIPSFYVPLDMILFGGGHGGGFNGDISEVLVYNSGLTDLNRRKVECYLGVKYSVVVTGHSCTVLTFEQSAYEVNTGASVTVKAMGGEPPYTYSVVSGAGSVVGTTGVYTATSSVGVATVRVTDNLGSTADIRVLVAGKRPSDIFGLKVWYSASMIRKSDNQEVAIWPDLSGNSFHAISSTPTPRAIFKPSQVNGFPVIRGTTSNLLASGVGSSWGSTNATAVMVLNMTGDTSYGVMKLSSSPNSWLRYFANTQGYWGTFRDVRLESNPSVSLPTMGPQIFTIVSGPGYYHGFLNGTQILNTTSSFGLSTNLSVFFENGDSGYYDGEIADLMIYNEPLSTSDRQALECAYGHKLNIASAIAASCL